MQNQIVNLLQVSGGRLTRNQLYQQLPNPTEQPTEEYLEAEQGLVDAKRIERRRGRNGGIYLVPPQDTATATSEAAATRADLAADSNAEAAHYQPVLESILTHWVEQPGFTHVFGAITAAQGRRPTGGRWSRPDLIICTGSDWIFSSRPEGEVRTVEVKRYETLDILAVYEAVSHKSRAHYSYVLVVNFPEQLNPDQETDFDAILSVAGKHGIGIITARDSQDWATWTFELGPGRSDADHQTVHQLLLDQVLLKFAEQFRAAIRSVTIQLNI